MHEKLYPIILRWGKKLPFLSPQFRLHRKRALLCHPCSEADWRSSCLQGAVLRRWFAPQKRK